MNPDSILQINRKIYDEFGENEAYAPGILKVKQIVRVLETIPSREKIADIGCHTGFYTLMYSAVKGVKTIDGFDIAPKALEKFRSRGFKGYSWEGGTEPCPAESSAYDVLIAGDLLEHVVNNEYLIREFWRIIKPGGHALISTPNLYYWLNRMKMLAGKPLWNIPGVSPLFRTTPVVALEHIRVHGTSDWRKFFEARGFEVVSVKGLLWAPPTTFKNAVLHVLDRVIFKARCNALFVLRKKEWPADVPADYKKTDGAEHNREIFNALNEDEPLDAPSLLKARQIADVLKEIPRRAKVADLGCHTGRYMEVFAKVPGVEAVEGFDIADRALESVRAKGFKGHIWNAEKDKCPVEDGRFDVIIAGDIIEHVIDTEFFLAEMKRILKPGGRIILTTPNLFYWLSRIKFLFARAPWAYPGVSYQFKSDPNMISEHIRLYGFDEWQGFFEARGFETSLTKGLLWVTPGGFKNNLISLVDRIMPDKARFLCLFLFTKKE